MKLNLTQKGKELLLRCIDLADDGEVLTLNALTIGNGVHAGEAGEEMQNRLMNLDISESVRRDEYIELTCVFDNSAVNDRFRITEMGVLAKNPDDENNPVLFAYGYVPENEAAVIPSTSDYIFETSITVSVYIGTLENIEVTLEGKMIGVSKEDFQAHKNDNNNPHKITAEQIGLENVENKKLTEQTPVYTVSKELQPVSPGEKMGVLLGKLTKGLRDFIDHIKDPNNPHKITASQIGASKSEHTHSANDIKSGVLPVERGGTGVKNLQELLAGLRACGIPTVQSVTYTGNGKNEWTITFTQGVPKFVILSELGTDQDLATVFVYGASGYNTIMLSDALGSGTTSWKDTYDENGNVTGCVLTITKGWGTMNREGQKYVCIGIS